MTSDDVRGHAAALRGWASEHAGARPVAAGAFVFLAFAGLLCATVWQRSAGARLDEARAQWAQQQAQPASAVPTARMPDFVQALPARAVVEDVVRDLQRFSATAGAGFVAVDAVPRPAGSAQGASLGGADLSVTLRGSYPQLKAVLAELMARHANLVLQRLTFRRLAGPTEIEAALLFSLVTRPADADVAAR